MGRHRLEEKKAFKKISEIHLNLTDDSRFEYNGSEKSVTLKCNIHNYWFNTIYRYVAYDKRNCGCRYCKATCGELQIMKMLDRLGVEFEYDKDLYINGKKYNIDFYIEATERVHYPIWIEFDGENHFHDVFHNQKYQVDRDNIINKWMIQHKQNFLRTSHIDFQFEDNFRAICQFILYGYNCIGRLGLESIPEVFVCLYYGVAYEKMVIDTKTYFGKSYYNGYKNSWLYVGKTK